MKYVRDVPDDVINLTGEVLADLRANRGDDPSQVGGLSDRQQMLFDELGERCIGLLVDRPEAANLLGKQGAHEGAYAINIAEVDGAALRVHYFSQVETDPEEVARIPSADFDVGILGTPHNHKGDIAAVAPIGRITHHLFEEVEGSDFTVGGIAFEEAPDPTRSYKFNISRFLPLGPVGLRHLADETVGEATGGYALPQRAIHIVTWEEPTATVFLNDFANAGESRVYMPAGAQEIDRQRLLPPGTMASLWGEFMDLVQRG